MQQGPIEMSCELLCSWHREIFGILFPEDAGRLRWRQAGEWEHVQFGGLIGTQRSRRVRGYRGFSPRALPRRLQKICEEFNAAAAQLRRAGGERYTAVHAAARLYAKILRAHPWIDGNLRTAIVALDAALLTVGLPRVEFTDLELHDQLLGIAFVGKHDPYRPLAEHVLQITQSSESS
jgi:fido (protein-threonine AMPylation protein)